MLEEGGSWKLYQIQNAILLACCMAAVMIFLLFVGVVKITLPPLQKNRTGNGEKNHRKVEFQLWCISLIFAIGKSAMLQNKHFGSNVNPNGDTTHPERTLQGWKQS